MNDKNETELLVGQIFVLSGESPQKLSPESDLEGDEKNKKNLIFISDPIASNFLGDKINNLFKLSFFSH